MSSLYAGFTRVNITPMLGIEMYGYYSTREADGILDELEINTIALADRNTKVLLIAVSHPWQATKKAATKQFPPTSKPVYPNS